MLNITNHQVNAHQNHNLESVKMAKRQQQSRHQCGEKELLMHSSWNYKLVQLLREHYEVSKIKTEVPRDPSNFMGVKITKENKTLFQKRYMHLNVHCSIVYNSKDSEANPSVHQQKNG